MTRPSCCKKPNLPNFGDNIRAGDAGTLRAARRCPQVPAVPATICPQARKCPQMPSTARKCPHDWRLNAREQRCTYLGITIKYRLKRCRRELYLEELVLRVTARSCPQLPASALNCPQVPARAAGKLRAARKCPQLPARAARKCPQVPAKLSP